MPKAISYLLEGDYKLRFILCALALLLSTYGRTKLFFANSHLGFKFKGFQKSHPKPNDLHGKP